MALPDYESPTFLGQKDTYMVGLTLPQLLASLTLGGVWFLFCLLLPYGMVVKLGAAGALTGLTVLLLFGRLAGMSVPGYLALSLARSFHKPGWEDLAEDAVAGDPDWLALREWRAERAELARAAGKRRGMFSFLRGRGRQALEEVAPAERRSEVAVDLEKGVSDMSMALESNVRDAVRTLVKG